MVDAQVTERPETTVERQEAGAVAALAMLHELHVERDGAPAVGHVGMDRGFQPAPERPGA